MKAKHLLLGLLTLLSASANAVPITYSFSASWYSEIRGPLTAPGLPIAPTNFFGPSNAITGSFTYDGDAALIPASSTSNTSVYRGPISNLTASVGGYAISDPSGYGLVTASTDIVSLAADPDILTPVAPEFRNISGFGFDGWALENFRLFWVDDPTVGGDTDAVTNLLLPSELPPAGFDAKESRIALDFVDSARTQRHVAFFQNLTVTKVPEPGVLPLMTIGFLLLIFTIRKQRLQVTAN